MAGNRSAFTTQTRGLDEHINLDATDYHLIPYVTGGLGRLVHLIREEKVPDLPEFGHHTDSDGHFAPQGACLMALRYEVKQILDSKGQSAVLVLAEDLFQKNRLVVIKVLHTQFYKLGVQETHVLWRLAMSDPLNHSHTLRILTTFTFDGHYCMVFEPLLPDPLTTIFQEFPKHKLLSNIKKVGLRLLATMGFLHQQNLIHTDLKPDNILLKYENDLDSVHIVDFGNTINYVHSEVSLYYKDFELQTPLYRAPEVIFGVPFGPEIDIWSLGCIFAELYLGKPLLLGDAMEDILKQICELLGPCPAKVFRRGKFFRNLKQYTSNEDQMNASTKIFEHLQLEDYLFADLLAGMLRYNPDERLTASEAAQHPFFASYFPVAFLVPAATGRSVLSSVPLSKDTYKFSPNIAPDIKKGQPTSVDLLRLGTSGIHPTSDLEETVILKPSPRYKMKGENLSIFEEPTHLFPTTTGIGKISTAYKHSDNGHSDVPFVKNVNTEKKERILAGNIKEKMSSLLRAIRHEQNLVENDLEERFDNYRKIAGSFHTVKPTDSSVSVKPIPRYGAYREDTLRQTKEVKQSSQDLQTVTRKPSYETTKVGEKQGAVTRKNETFLVKTERNCSLKACQGKSSTEIIGQHNSHKQSDLRQQGMETVSRKDGLDDRTFTLQQHASAKSDRPNTNNQTTAARVKITNSSGNNHRTGRVDSPNKARALDVSVSPGFTSSRTKYTPKVLQKDVQDKFRQNSSSSVLSSSLSSVQKQTESVEREGEIKAFSETFDRKIGSSSSRGHSKTTHPDGTKTPGRRLKEISSEGRKRVYADCLSDDEVIDVLSPISYGSVSKRQKQLNTGPEKRRHSLNNEYKDDVYVKSSDSFIDTYDSLHAATAESDKITTVSTKSNAANEKIYTSSREGNNIEHVTMDKAEKRCPRDPKKAKMSYLMTNVRDMNDENNLSDQEPSFTEIDRDGALSSENDSCSHYGQATVMASTRGLYQDQTPRNNAQTKPKSRQFKLKSAGMPTPISTIPEAAGVMIDIAEDSPEIIYKSVRCGSRENKPRTWKHFLNDNHQVYHKHGGTGYARDSQIGEALTHLQKVFTDNQRQKISTENQDQKKSQIVKDTTERLKSSLNNEINELQMEFQKPDKFTFIGTPASDLKNEGRLAERIVERNKKLKKKARKSLNFQQSADDLDDESSDESENSEEFVGESIVETSNRAHDLVLSQQMKNTVKKTFDKSSDFYIQNASKGRTSIELHRRSSAINNPKGRGMMKVNRHSKCDSTFVLDFESPLRHTEWKK